MLFSQDVWNAIAFYRKRNWHQMRSLTEGHYATLLSCESPRTEWSSQLQLRQCPSPNKSKDGLMGSFCVFFFFSCKVALNDTHFKMHYMNKNWIKMSVSNKMHIMKWISKHTTWPKLWGYPTPYLYTYCIMIHILIVTPVDPLKK